MSEERWLPVRGFEGAYEVSSLGLVRRIAAGKGTRAGKLLKPLVCKNGYSYAALCNNGLYSRRLIHAIVMDSFVGARPKWHIINHKDGVKTNNLLSNLEYITSSANSNHAARAKLLSTGEQHPFAKLTTEIARQIKHRLKQGEPKAHLAREFGVSSSSIRDIERGLTWTAA